MPLSFSQTASLTCPQCKSPFQSDIWLIVDAGERPDLAARCHDGSIHVVTCPNNHSGMIAAPLLYHDRAKQQLFLAYPDGMSEQQVQETGNQLVQQLRGQLLILPGSSYLDAPQAVPMELLPVAMDDKLDEVLAELQARMEQAEQLRRNPTIAAAVRVLQEHHALGETIQEWMNLDAWNTSKQFLETHPELLSNDAELVLAAMLDLARAQGDVDAQRLLNAHCDIARVAREGGITSAYQKYLARGADDGDSSNALAELEERLAELGVHSRMDLERAFHQEREMPDELRSTVIKGIPLLNALDTLMGTDSPKEILRLVKLNPSLLSDEALYILRKSIDETRGEDETITRALEQRLLFLEKFKASGIPIDQLEQLDQPEGIARNESSQDSISETVRSVLQEILRLSSPSQMPRRIELCYLALEDLGYERQPELWAALQNMLAHSFLLNPQGDRSDNIEQAILHYNLALQVQTRQSDPDSWAAIQANLANAYYNRVLGVRAENIELSLEHSVLALQIYTRDEFGEQWANVQNNLATAYSERIQGNRSENIDLAIRHYRLGMQVYTRERFPVDWAMILHNLAAAYVTRINGERAENLEKAIHYYEMAAQIRTRQTKPEDWAMTQNALGIAYKNRVRGEPANNLEQALQHIKFALQVYARESHPREWAGTMNNLGNVYSVRIQGDPAHNLEEAIQCYEAALSVYSPQTFPEQWASIENNLANAYQSRMLGERAENLEEAIRHYQFSLKINTREAFPIDWANTENNLATCYFARLYGERAENLKEAVQHCSRALLVHTPESWPERSRATAVNLGVAFAELENWTAAHNSFSVARKASEVLLRSVATPNGFQNEMRQAVDLFARDLAVCARLYATDRSIACEALEESEAARSRAFLRQLGLGDLAPPASIPTALATQEKNILAQLRDIENNLAGADTRSDRMSEMERTLTARRAKLANELVVVWNEMLSASPDAAAYVSVRRGDTPAWEDLAQLATRLGNDTALVEYHLLADQTLVFVWCAGWDAPKMLALPLSRERLLYRYLLPYQREVLSTDRRSQAKASEREMYHDWLGLGEELLAPLKPLLGAASLVYFIPHQYLHLLPLHALTVNGEPFIARRAVAYAPSAAVLKRVLTTDDGRQTKDDGQQPLVMGYTEHAWQREIFVGEAHKVAGLFGTTAVADEHATRAALTSRAPTASLIHLSCHGAFDGDDSLNSAVLLADGAFTAREWMRLNLHADLVALSACQLAFSDVNPGDDLVGMTRALMYAGASSVLLALWSVRADTTLEWMLDFYKRLKPNGTAQAKAHAFRDATLELRKKHDDPYIWAPFVLVGDWA